MDRNIYLKHLAEVVDTLYLVDDYDVVRVVEALRNVRVQHGTAWIMGNGGSAATASHFANDLTKMAGLRAIAVSDMTPMVTAFGNDDGWENMFLGVLSRMERAVDVAIGISCSGNSLNVVKALESSKSHYRIALTGPNTDNLITKIAPEYILRAKHSDIRVQEDVHSILCHGISRMLAK